MKTVKVYRRGYDYSKEEFKNEIIVNVPYMIRRSDMIDYLRKLFGNLNNYRVYLVK